MGFIDFAASFLVCCLLAHRASRLEEAQAVVLQDQLRVAPRVPLRPVVVPTDACFLLAVVENSGCESRAVAAIPDEGQPMLLVLVEGLFSDAVAVAVDFPDDAMSRAGRVPRALVLAAVVRYILPLGIRGLVAGLHPWHRQARAALLPECIEHGDGKPS